MEVKHSHEWDTRAFQNNLYPRYYDELFEDGPHLEFEGAQLSPDKKFIYSPRGDPNIYKLHSVFISTPDIHWPKDD